MAVIIVSMIAFALVSPGQLTLSYVPAVPQTPKPPDKIVDPDFKSFTASSAEPHTFPFRSVEASRTEYDTGETDARAIIRNMPKGEVCRRKIRIRGEIWTKVDLTAYTVGRSTKS